jgi:hypothetical protein
VPFHVATAFPDNVAILHVQQDGPDFFRIRGDNPVEPLGEMTS